MCAPNSSIDDIIDHLESRGTKIRQALSITRMGVKAGVSTSGQNFQVRLESAVTASRMLPVKDMK